MNKPITHDSDTIRYVLMLGARCAGYVEDEYLSKVKYVVKQTDGSLVIRLQLGEESETVVDRLTHIFTLNEVKQGDTISIGHTSKHISKNRKPIPPTMPIEQYMVSLLGLFGVTAGVMLFTLWFVMKQIS